MESLVPPEAFHPERSPRSPWRLADQIAAKSDDQLLAEFAAKGDADVKVSDLSEEQRRALAEELRQFEAMAASLEAR